MRRRSGGHPNHFGIRLDVRLPRAEGCYAFQVAAKPGGRYSVQQEECVVVGEDGRHSSYKVAEGQVVASTIPNPPACASDRLYLVNTSGLEAFRPLYDALSGMGFSNPNPKALGDLQARPTLRATRATHRRVYAASRSTTCCVIPFTTNGEPRSLR